MKRKEVIEQAKILVGDNGEVKDYPCDCSPGGERFIVKWINVSKGKFPICYNLEQLIEECKNI